MNDIAAAVSVLRNSQLVAFPTETVYGLGADAASEVALANLYRVKGRPLDHPVIVHIADASQLDVLGVGVPETARALATAFWPGPLTLVVQRNRSKVSDGATGGRDTVGLRVPRHPLALELLTNFGGGVAAPSANRFGKVSPTTAAHVRADLGDDVEVVLDGGPCIVGVESTIVDCSRGDEVRILRVGDVGIDQVAAIIGTTPILATTGEISAPGTLASHYTPDAQVEIVDARELAPAVERHQQMNEEVRVGVLALADVLINVTGVTVLESPETVVEFAQVLYARLREADDKHLDLLLVVPPPAGGIGNAVRDRLSRAAR